MKKIVFTIIITIIAFFVFIPIIAIAEDDTLTIGKSTDEVRYGKTVIYTAYVNGEAVEGEYIWFVNNVKQEETSNTFTYTHREGEVTIYAKYNNLVSNTLTDNVRYTLAELLIYYSLAVAALLLGIPFLVYLSKRQHRSPLDIAYADLKRLILQTCRLEESLNTGIKVKEIRIMRLSFSLNAAAEVAQLAHEDTQIAVLQIANTKLKEAYVQIHSIKTSMPLNVQAEKAASAKEFLKEAKVAFDTFSKAQPTESEEQTESK